MPLDSSEGATNVAIENSSFQFNNRCTKCKCESFRNETLIGKTLLVSLLRSCSSLDFSSIWLVIPYSLKFASLKSISETYSSINAIIFHCSRAFSILKHNILRLSTCIVFFFCEVEQNLCSILVRSY